MTGEGSVKRSKEKAKLIDGGTSQPQSDAKYLNLAGHSHVQNLDYMYICIPYIQSRVYTYVHGYYASIYACASAYRFTSVTHIEAKMLHACVCTILTRSIYWYPSILRKWRLISKPQLHAFVVHTSSFCFVSNCVKDGFYPERYITPKKLVVSKVHVRLKEHCLNTCVPHGPKDSVLVIRPPPRSKTVVFLETKL